VTNITPATPEPRLKKNVKAFWFVLGCSIVSVCIVCAAIMVVGIALFLILPSDGSTEEMELSHPAESATRPPALAEAPTESPTVETRVASAEAQVDLTPAVEATMADTIESILAPPPDIEQTPLEDRHWLDLQALMDEGYPPRDYYESAARLGSSYVGERTIHRDPYIIGDRQVFRTDEGRVQAELLAVTDHAYFWVETALDFDSESVTAAAARFEEEYYPVVSRLFGEEWRPGVDNDVHFSVLHLDGYNGDGELGFFNSGDEYPWAVVINSNQQEIVYLNMANLSLGDDLYQGTLIHEVQHLIQWHNDANEAIWINEGLAQLIELYAGLDTVDTATDYLHKPGIPLNSWNFEDEESLYAHYGATFLFSVYLWEQLGLAAISDLSSQAADGLAGVQTILEKYRPDITLVQFLSNWAVANYLDDLTAGSEYGYANLRLHRPVHEEEISSSDYGALKRINQYGVHYIQLDHSGPTTISFVGDTTAALMGTSTLSSERMWYAPMADELDAQLAVNIDLTGLNRATLDFSVWYDLEEDFDFAYVTISSDSAVSPDILKPEHSSSGEFGPAFSGKSQDEANNDGGWVSESIDLSQYTGQMVTIRFEVLTDPAISGGGFAIDNIAVPELGFMMDADTEAVGWSADGFVQTSRLLPQPWAVILIEEGLNRQVTPLSLNELNQGRWTFDFGEDGGILVVSALNPMIATPASYWLSAEQ
jgi:immune inhibitor A